MLNPVPILFSVVVIRHEYCTQLSVQNIVLRQLKVQRIYNFLVSGVCRWWPISREGNKKTVEFSSHGSYQVKSGKFGGTQDCRLSNLLLVRETNIFQWPFLYGWFQDFQENAIIVDNISIWSWCKWILVVCCLECLVLMIIHTYYVRYDDCRYLLTLLTHPRFVKVRYSWPALLLFISKLHDSLQNPVRYLPDSGQEETRCFLLSLHSQGRSKIRGFSELVRAFISSSSSLR